MQAAVSGSLRSLLARPLIDQVANSTTKAVSTMTATAGSRFIEALIKSIGKSPVVKKPALLTLPKQHGWAVGLGLSAAALTTNPSIGITLLQVS